MSDERETLIDQANLLALDFPKNIPTEKLKRMIEETKGPLVKEDTNSSEEEEKTVKLSFTQKDLRKRINEAKRRAFKTQVVTITNKDSRENDFMTTVHLGFENQYFGMSKIVPLDVPVELEQALIDLAENTMMTLHKDEIIDGKRTGNKTTVMVKKFAISYGKQNIE